MISYKDFAKAHTWVDDQAENEQSVDEILRLLGTSVEAVEKAAEQRAIRLVGIAFHADPMAFAGGRMMSGQEWELFALFKSIYMDAVAGALRATSAKEGAA